MYIVIRCQAIVVSLTYRIFQRQTICCCTLHSSSNSLASQKDRSDPSKRYIYSPLGSSLLLRTTNFGCTRHLVAACGHIQEAHIEPLAPTHLHVHTYYFHRLNHRLRPSRIHELNCLGSAVVSTKIRADSSLLKSLYNDFVGLWNTLSSHYIIVN